MFLVLKVFWFSVRAPEVPFSGCTKIPILHLSLFFNFFFFLGGGLNKLYKLEDALGRSLG